MTLDFMKIAQGILTAVHVVEKIKGAKGPDKLSAVVDSTPEMIQVVEANLGKDVINDPAVVEAERQFISSYVTLQKAIAAAKQAKGTGQPV